MSVDPTVTPVGGTVSAPGSVGPTVTPVGGTVSALGSVDPTVTPVTPVGGAMSTSTKGSSNVHSESDSVSDSESVGTIPIASNMTLF